MFILDTSAITRRMNVGIEGLSPRTSWLCTPTRPKTPADVLHRIDQVIDLVSIMRDQFVWIRKEVQGMKERHSVVLDLAIALISFKRWSNMERRLEPITQLIHSREHSCFPESFPTPLCSHDPKGCGGDPAAFREC